PLLLVLAGGMRAARVAAVESPPPWATTARALEPLSAAEERDPAAVEIARRFNPTMALPDADGPWPVAVRYTWSAGADLQTRTVAAGGTVLHSGTAVAGADPRRRSSRRPRRRPRTRPLVVGHSERG